ncbi:uncharacterized protein LOC141830316 [Curcuma longa]|uniref:uncharacterized protein LOC141830316 n=1 Tax=Curcuma longa TaxID=136217 RepID=UPI003D9DCB00
MTTERRRKKERAPEDRLTSLHDDLLISIVSFLPINQRVVLSAVSSHFRRRLIPSLIPRVDTFRVDVGLPSRRGVAICEQFPRALLRQCHIVVHNFVYLTEHDERLLVEALLEVGVQDLVLGTFGKGWLHVSDEGGSCGFFGIKSLRSISLGNIRVPEYFRPVSPLGCALLTSLKMEVCVLRDDFLRNLFASCPFLETLQLIYCCRLEHGMGRLSIQSASIKHLVLDLFSLIRGIDAIDVRAPKLESLVVDVVNELHIEAPKAQTASFFLSFIPQNDPSVALMNLFRAPFPSGLACLALNSSSCSRTSNVFAGIDKFYRPEHKEDGIIFNLDFNLKDQSSTMILTKLLEKCNNHNTKFDIRVDSRHIENTTETASYGLTGSELIKLRMTMPEKRFKAFLSNRKKMKKLKLVGLKILRRRASKEQLMDILASEEDSLFQVSSTIANSIEMKF